MNKGRPRDVSKARGGWSPDTVTITIILLAYLLDVIILPLGVQKLSGGTKDTWFLSQVVETVGLGGKRGSSGWSSQCVGWKPGQGWNRVGEQPGDP